MEMHTSEEAVCAELKELLLEQIETLTAHHLGELTEEQLLQYAMRYARIRELCRQLLTPNNLAA